MKLIFVLCMTLISFSVLAKDVSFKLDLSAHLQILSDASLYLTYESRSNAVGCQTYSGDILDPSRPIYINKRIAIGRDGRAYEVIQTQLERCRAQLISITLKLGLNREAIARQVQTSRNEVVRTTELNFGVYEYTANLPVREPKLAIVRHYVAGSSTPKYTLSSTFLAVGIMNDQINLSL